jgi:uncharacterized metal-binding protein YceD (DUF177 family)
MEDRFKIFVERLRDGHTEQIQEVFLPDFLEIQDEDLLYQDNVYVKGKAYLVEDNLIIHLDIRTSARLPCIICNEPVVVPVEIHGFYHTEPIAGIKGSVFNYTNVLREIIILESPVFAECKGKCPQREEIEKYLFKEKGENPEEGYHPFSDL